MKKLVGWLVVAVTMIGVLPMGALADTKPYFKVFGGDVFAGGWFNSGATSCSVSDSNYQAPTYAPLTDQYKGGILAFATSARLGASTDFGAIAMGLIEGDSGKQYGFYTGGSGTSTLSFANSNDAIGSNYWGGYWAGATQQTHCLPDYYATKQSSPTNLGTAANLNLSSLSSSQYIVTPTGASVSLTAGSGIAKNADITLFVNGNAYISGNIVYAAGYTADEVPKLAIVARGEIYIDPLVTQMDGLYIAQPGSSSGGGVWTCHDGTNTIPDGYWVRSNCGSGGGGGSCTNKLTINGAVIAKQVMFLRTNGDLAGAPANETNSSCNISEIINYIPAMVIGGAFFNPPNSPTPNIDSLISLPPVF